MKHKTYSPSPTVWTLLPVCSSASAG